MAYFRDCRLHLGVDHMTKGVQKIRGQSQDFAASTVQLVAADLSSHELLLAYSSIILKGFQNVLDGIIVNVRFVGYLRN